MGDEKNRDKTDAERFGDLVKERRKAFGMTLESIAKEAYDNPNRRGYVSKIAKGEIPGVTPNTVRTIARVLHIDYEEIPLSLRWFENETAIDERSRSRIEDFQNIANTEGFRIWRLAAVKALHAHKMRHIGSSCKIFPRIGTTDYPIAILPSADCTSLSQCAESRLTIEERLLYPTPAQLWRNNHALDQAAPGLSGSQKEYLSDLLLAKKIRRPNQPGYALSSLTLNEEGCVASFDAKVCHYLDNVRSCHYIEYVLYKALGKT